MRSMRFTVILAAVLTTTPALAAPPPDLYGPARELYSKIVRFQTSVGLGQVPEMAAFLADQFRTAGFAAEDVHVLPFGETASLVVRYRGTAPVVDRSC